MTTQNQQINCYFSHLSSASPLRRSCSTLSASLVFFLFLGLTVQSSFAQGCVASGINPCAPIGSAGLLSGDLTNGLVAANRWLGSVSYRWFRSDRHFVGDVEQPQRQAIGNEVVNDVHSFDVSATYGINSRWSATITFPFFTAERSSWYEHTGTNRHSMHSGGLGDIRVVTDVWLLDPHKHMDGNLALGVGFKAPTGDDKASDTAYRTTGPIIRPVDQSIQPGDGGWGIILQLQAFQRIYGNLSAYLQGSYMVTPEEQNDTRRTTGNEGAPVDVRTFNSITDQYFGRGGLSYFVWPEQGLALSLGGRIEGVPVYDAVGGSLGFRRPGYTVSVEPGISWTGRNNSLSITAPVALYRNRERSAPEIALGRPGGDAAFADYSILASFTHRF